MDYILKLFDNLINVLRTDRLFWKCFKNWSSFWTESGKLIEVFAEIVKTDRLLWQKYENWSIWIVLKTNRHLGQCSDNWSTDFTLSWKLINNADKDNIDNLYNVMILIDRLLIKFWRIIDNLNKVLKMDELFWPCFESSSTNLIKFGRLIDNLYYIFQTNRQFGQCFESTIWSKFWKLIDCFDSV